MKFSPVNRTANSVFDLFDDVLSTPFFTANQMMKTDIREKDGKYYFDIDLPGYAKEDIEISLYNGNLSIKAARNTSNEEKDDKGTVIRQERYTGTCERSFYVGDAIRETDIHASFSNGILTLEIPTAEQKEKEEKKYIDIL
jgi:HSP20 family molecular chaperone IbpA